MPPDFKPSVETDGKREPAARGKPRWKSIRSVPLRSRVKHGTKIAHLFLNWHIGILPYWLIISILTQSFQIIQYIRFTFLYQAVNHFAEQGVNPGEPGTGELLWIVFVE